MFLLLLKYPELSFFSLIQCSPSSRRFLLLPDLSSDVIIRFMLQSSAWRCWWILCRLLMNIHVCWWISAFHSSWHNFVDRFETWHACFLQLYKFSTLRKHSCISLPYLRSGFQCTMIDFLVYFNLFFGIIFQP